MFIKITKEELLFLKEDHGFTHLVVNSSNSPDGIAWVQIPWRLQNVDGFHGDAKTIDLSDCDCREVKGLLWAEATLPARTGRFIPSFILVPGKIFSAPGVLAEVVDARQPVPAHDPWTDDEEGWE